MMSFSRSTQALFWITRLVRLSPLASTAPLSTNFSPGFSESFSGIWGAVLFQPGHHTQAELTNAWFLYFCVHWRLSIERLEQGRFIRTKIKKHAKPAHL